MMDERDNNMEGMDTYDESMMLGGAKRTNNGKSWVDGVFFMIKNAKQIECISTDSLYGFIFVVELKDGIDDKVIPFQSITRGSSGSTHNIKKLLLKFSLVYDETSQNKMNLKQFMKKNLFNRKIKGIDTIQNFDAEVKKQIDIFQKTSTHGGLANCPSIVFDRACTNGESKIFLEMLLSRPTYVESCDMHSSTRNSLRYLYDVVSKKTELRLGLIAMEYAERTDSQTQNNKFVLFNQLYKRIVTENDKMKWGKYVSGTDYVLYHRIALILSNMIILLLECGIVHCDLHFNNVFVIDYTKNKTRISSSSGSCISPLENTTSKSCIRIIDFGRVQNVTYDKNSFIESVIKYTKSETPGNDKAQSVETRAAAQPAYPDSKLYDSIIEILKFIYDTDLEYTRKINPTVNVPQCVGYFILAGLVAQNPPGGQYTFVKTTQYTDVTKMKYVMDLISGYLIDYYEIVGSKKQADGLYQHTDDTDTSFVSQLLQYQLETLRDSLELTEVDYTSMTYTTSKTVPTEPATEPATATTEIVSYFDLVTSGGNSIREQRYDLKPLFASIDSIIQEITSISS